MCNIMPIAITYRLPWFGFLSLVSEYICWRDVLWFSQAHTCIRMGRWMKLDRN